MRTLRLLAPLTLIFAVACATAKPEPDPYADRVMYGPPKDAPAPMVPKGPPILRDDTAVSPTPSVDGTGAEAVVTRNQLDELLDRGPAFALGQVRVKASKEGGKFRGFEIVSFTPQAKTAIAPHLQVGDVITHLNGVRLQKPGDYMDAWKGLKKVRAIRIDYLRQDQAQSALWSVQDAAP